MTSRRPAIPIDFVERLLPKTTRKGCYLSIGPHVSLNYEEHTMHIGSMLLAFTFMLTHQVAVAETTESPSSSLDTPRGRSGPDAE